MTNWERLARKLMHPLRLRALQAIEGSSEPRSPHELAKELDEKLGNVSYHVRKLREEGHIELAKTEPRRGALEHYYRASGAADE